MNLKVLRYNSAKNYTDGLLFIDDVFKCYTLEDEKRVVKVAGETRIPAGTYKVAFRTEGGFHGRYLQRFGERFHKGMLHVLDVPNFKWILIHVGNDEDDTAGCLLVGSTADKNKGFIGGSVSAYKEVYKEISEALLNDEEVTIEYVDLA